MTGQMFDLIMREYKQPLSELREWTLGQVVLFMKKIGERYERQSKARGKKRGTREVTEADLIGSDFMKG